MVPDAHPANRLARKDCSRRTPLGLRFAPARRRAVRGSVHLVRRRPKCRTRLFVGRRFESLPTKEKPRSECELKFCEFVFLVYATAQIRDVVQRNLRPGYVCYSIT